MPEGKGWKERQEALGEASSRAAWSLRAPLPSSLLQPRRLRTLQAGSRKSQPRRWSSARAVPAGRGGLSARTGRASGCGGYWVRAAVRDVLPFAHAPAPQRRVAVGSVPMRVSDWCGGDAAARGLASAAGAGQRTHLRGGAGARGVVTRCRLRCQSSSRSAGWRRCAWGRAGATRATPCCTPPTPGSFSAASPCASRCW